MTESEIKLVEELWQKGKSIRYIVKLLPYKPFVAQKKIKQMEKEGKIEKRNPRTKQDTIAKVLHIYDNETRNPYEIAERLNLSFGYIKDILDEERKGKIRPKHNYKKTKEKEFYALSQKTREILGEIKSGKKVRDIAQEKKVSTQYVHSLRKKYPQFLQ